MILSFKDISEYVFLNYYNFVITKYFNIFISNFSLAGKYVQ